MLKLLGIVWVKAGRVRRYALMFLLRPLFAAHGNRFWFDPDGTYSFSTIRVGDNVSLGLRPKIVATRSKVSIGSNVMFGPEVTIMGGNHTTAIIGRVMVDVQDKEKRPEDDRDVVIEDDVWLGTRVVILQGVRIGRGAIVGAGAVVTKSVPPYAVAVGVPARVVKFRWDVDTIVRHEELLYAPSERLRRETLEKSRRELGA